MRKHNLIISILLLVSASLWQFTTAAAQGGEEPQIRITQVDNSKFPNVVVYFSATNAAGEPVGIDPSMIQIYENSQLMQLSEVKGGGEVVSGETVPVTTMLVIDISGSMDKNDKITAAKEAAKSYVSQMRPGDQAGVIAYDTHVYMVQALTADTTALSSAIDGLQTGSDTAMYNALIEAEKALETASGRKAIIVLTDGMDNQSQVTADEVVSSIGESGLTISAIGLGDATLTGQEGLNEAGLKTLAERTGGIYGYVTDSEALKGLYQQQSRALQSEYQVTYVSPFTLRDGINRNLTVSLASGAASTEGTYNPGGVLPEVTSRSWETFGIILLGLLILLFLPMLMNLGSRSLSGLQRRSTGNQAASRLPRSQPSVAKGRIKLK